MQVTLGKHSKGPFLHFSHEDKLVCDSAARGLLKKAFAKPSRAWYTPRTKAKVSKMVTVMGTATWMGDSTLFNSQWPTLMMD